MKNKLQILGAVLCLVVAAHAQVQINGSVSISGQVVVSANANTPTCTITTASQPNGTTGSPYTGNILSTTGCTGPISYTATGVPPGITVSPSTGQPTGTPTLAGTYSTTITGTDSSTPAQHPVVTYTIQIANSLPPPSCQITTSTEPSGTQFTSYLGNVLNTANCTAPLTFTASSGNLPNNTTMTSSNGQVTGNPNVAGTFTFNAHVVDNAGNHADQSLTIVINPAPACTITTTVEPQATVGTPYTSATIQTANCKAPVAFSSTASVPGLSSFSTSTGVFSGTPTTAGNYPAPITATDSTTPPQAPTANLVIQVNPSSSTGLNPYCNSSEVWTGTKDGVANPNNTCVRTAMADTPVSGRTVNVTAGSFSSLQSAINSALCGDTIIVPSTVSAGVQAVYSGSLAPAKTCTGSNWIIVESDQVATMPEGQRITPAWAGIASFPGHPPFANQPSGGPAILMPQIISSTGSNIATASGASHWRFIGLELTTPAGAAMIQNPLFHVCIACDHIIFDRGWIHGGNNHNDQDIDSVQSAFHNDGTYAALQYSTVTDIHCITGTCVDNSAVDFGGNLATATGPTKVVGNFLEAAGECFFNGGGGVGTTTVPAPDMEFRNNHCFKPLYWYILDPTYLGTEFVVKNQGEMKNGQRGLFEGNIFENSWEGQADQFGEMINLGSKNQASGFSGNANTSGGGTVPNANWTQAFTNPSNCGYIHGFAIRASNNEWYIACHTSAVVEKSSDQGKTWTNISPSISGGDFWSVQVNPNDGSLVVQTQGGGSLGGKTYISTNDGTSWTLTQPAGWSGVVAGIHNGCAFSSSIMVCGAYNGSSNLTPWYSTNNGPNAANATSYTGGNNGSDYGIGLNPLDNCFFLGGEASGSFRSCNGHDWTLVFACINNCSGTNGNMTSFAFDTSGNALGAAQGGVYKSSGSGNSLTWTNVFHPGGQTNDIVSDSSGNLYVNAQTGAHAEYRSTDQGATWAAFDQGIASGLSGGFALQSPVDGKLYSVFFNDPAGTGSVYSTPINGSSPSGTVTWLSGPRQFASDQLASTCATPFHCNIKLNGVLYEVQSVTDSTHLVVTPNPGNQTSIPYTAYLTGLNPSAVVSDLTWRYNYFTHAARCMTFFTAASDGGDISTGTYDMEVHDNVCDDISTKWSPAGGCCFWASGYQVQNTFGAPNNMHDVEIHHTTVLAFQNAYSYGNGNGGPSMGFGVQSAAQGGVPNLRFYDNLGTAGWTGSASPCTSAGGSVLARFQCYDQLPPGTASNTYCFDHNFLATTTQGSAPNNGVTSVGPYPGASDSPGCGFTQTGNTLVGSFAAFQFTNLNGASGGNYLLQNTSPAHNAASDGTDAGANIPLLNQNIAGVQ